MGYDSSIARYKAQVSKSRWVLFKSRQHRAISASISCVSLTLTVRSEPCSPWVPHGRTITVPNSPVEPTPAQINSSQGKSISSVVCHHWVPPKNVKIKDTPEMVPVQSLNPETALLPFCLSVVFFSGLTYVSASSCFQPSALTCISSLETAEGARDTPCSWFT